MPPFQNPDRCSPQKRSKNNSSRRTSNVEAATAFKSRLGKITKNSHVHYDATTVLTLKTWISAKDLHLHVQFG